MVYYYWFKSLWWGYSTSSCVRISTTGNITPCNGGKNINLCFEYSPFYPELMWAVCEESDVSALVSQDSSVISKLSKTWLLREPDVSNCTRTGAPSRVYTYLTHNRWPRLHNDPDQKVVIKINKWFVILNI